MVIFPTPLLNVTQHNLVIRRRNLAKNLGDPSARAGILNWGILYHLLSHNKQN